MYASGAREERCVCCPRKYKQWPVDRTWALTALPSTALPSIFLTSTNHISAYPILQTGPQLLQNLAIPSRMGPRQPFLHQSCPPPTAPPTHAHLSAGTGLSFVTLSPGISLWGLSVTCSYPEAKPTLLSRNLWSFCTSGHVKSYLWPGLVARNYHLFVYIFVSSLSHRLSESKDQMLPIFEVSPSQGPGEGMAVIWHIDDAQ